MEKVYSFAFGDVVKPNKKTWVYPTANGAYIVTNYLDGKYGINGNSWFRFNDFKLVHRATLTSIRSAVALNDDSGEE